MGNVAISVEGLGKRYRIGSGPKEPYGSLRESMVRAAQAPLRRLRGSERRPDAKDIWALRDVSFEVKHGEAVGIIGRNGAGKSTLLKVLSRITEPTAGRAVVHGRVGSLLEVGTGFHPELTGRENIYLNGAVMGMSRAEIKRHFDEIVDFSGVEQFLDTPVKRYSSGMYMRLAFAVAAHLEPEILVVDEVLAVGDAEFQKKCLGKMSEVSRSGRTVLFVSHHLATILDLCQRCLWLDSGNTREFGSSSVAISAYLASGSTNLGQRVWPQGICNTGVSEFILWAVQMRNAQGHITGVVATTETVCVELEYEIKRAVPYCRVGLIVTTSTGIDVMEVYDTDLPEYDGVLRSPGRYTTRCTFPAHLFKAGRYTVSVNAGAINLKNYVYQEHVVSFEVEETRATGTTSGENRRGCIRPLVDWKVISI